MCIVCYKRVNVLLVWEDGPSCIESDLSPVFIFYSFRSPSKVHSELYSGSRFPFISFQ